MSISAVFATLALISLVAVTSTYSLLTSWYRTRTGWGFLSMLVAFTLQMGVTVVDIHWQTPLWVWWVTWALVATTVSFGVLWNIIYRQFIQSRPDLLGKRTSAKKEDNVGIDS